MMHLPVNAQCDTSLSKEDGNEPPWNLDSSDSAKELMVEASTSDSVDIRLANPLLGVPFDKLQQDVYEFSATHDLEEYRDLLFKGALCAQAQATGEYDSITILTEEDRLALQEEK